MIDINEIKFEYYELLNQINVKPVKKNNLWKLISDNENTIRLKHDLINFYKTMFNSTGVFFVNEPEVLIAIYHLDIFDKNKIELPEINDKESNEIVTKLVNLIKFDINIFPKSKMDLSDLSFDINLIYDLIFSYINSSERYENFMKAFPSHYNKNEYSLFLKFLKEYLKNNDLISYYRVKIRYGLDNRTKNNMLNSLTRIKKGYEF
jgi:hypothetical protein